MAEKPKSVQEKVTIRPTPIGARVIQRLGIPHVDKSGELRRLLELGLAAELAGFSLDGSTLRHGGRVWDLRMDLEQSVTSEYASRTTLRPAESSSNAPTSAPTGSKSVSAAAVEKQSPVSREAPGDLEHPTDQESVLRANLRGLSGGS